MFSFGCAGNHRTTAPGSRDRLLAAGPAGGRTLSSCGGRSAARSNRMEHRIAYAPAILPDGLGCAMSVHVGLLGMVVEVDRPGTLIPGRGVVPERDAAPRRARRIGVEGNSRGQSPPVLAGLSRLFAAPRRRRELVPMVPMPLSKIQRAFLSWLEENRDRFAVEIRLGARTDEVQEFSFAGINRAIEGALTSDEINVYAIHDNDCWDILLSVDAEPKRAHGGGFFCERCLTDARRAFADRPALWADHLFDPLLEWVNEDLARAKWLALDGSPGWATWARLMPGDDPSKTLRGGGYLLDFSALSEGVSRQELEERRVLLPCRV